MQLGGIGSKVFDPFAFDGGSDIKNALSSYANLVRSGGYCANVTMVTHATMRDVSINLFIALMTIAAVCLAAIIYAFFQISDFYTVSFYDLAKASKECNVKKNTTLINLELDNDSYGYRILIEETGFPYHHADDGSRAATVAQRLYVGDLKDIKEDDDTSLEENFSLIKQGKIEEKRGDI